MPLRSLADAFAFSSLLPAAIAYSLSFIASALLGAPDEATWALLASSGTFIVYTLDRLRDTHRDRETSPDRTAFVERNRRGLTVALGIATIGFGFALLQSPVEVIVLTLVIGSLGLLHRRIKRAAAVKALYVSFAWIGVCVGIPWIAAGRPMVGLWVAIALFPVFAANLVASNLRDDETQIFRGRPEVVLRIATSLAAIGGLVALCAPTPIGALFWIAAAELAAVLGFRPGERYGLLVIDGALWIGTGLAALHIGLSG